MKLYYALFLLFFLTFGLQAQNPELVSDIAPFPQGSSPGSFCNFNGKLFFAASRYNASSSNRELFFTDGTTSGTQLFKEIVPGNDGSNPENFIVLNGKMYFTIYNQFPNTAFHIPYVSDGTPEGTFPLSADPDVAVIGDGSAARFIFVALGDYVYFQSYEPNAPYNRVLYRTDGTQAGTQIVVQMPNNAAAPTLMQGPAKLGNKLLFTSQVNANGSNLYSYDPADGSVAMIRANTKFFNNYGWAEYNSKLYFTGSDLFDFQNGAELWVTDGTGAGTFEVENLNTTPEIDSAPGSYEVMNNKLYFIARATGISNTVTLFSIDGGLPAAVADIGGPTITYLHTYLYQKDNKFYFKGENAANGAEPWQSDGTAAGTGMIRDIWTGVSGTAPHTFISYCNDIYFTAGNPATGSAQALYKTDGTALGTQLVPGLATSPGIFGAGVTNKAVFGNKLYFTAQYDVNIQPELYRFDAQCALAVAAFAEVKISCYPNPSQDGRFTIVGAEISEISVFDMLGRNIPVEKSAENSFKINPESGLYLIKTNAGILRLLIP